jgi:MerR family redox-sensitive transcriptional activator SoxR
MAKLSIGEVARRVGINASAVRYYESVGLLPKPDRVNGRRRYGEKTVQMLTMIIFAQQAGFKLNEIQTLFQGFAPDTPAGDRWRTLARQKLVEVDALMQRAAQMKQLLELGMQCGCLRLEDCQLPATTALRSDRIDPRA